MAKKSKKNVNVENAVTAEVATEATTENTVVETVNGKEEIKMENAKTQVIVCSGCGAEIDFSTLSIAEKADLISKGLCPECAEKQRLEKAAKKAAREANKGARANRPESAYSKVLTMIKSSNLSPDTIELFLDKDFSTKAFGLAYSLLLPATEDAEVIIKGHRRYNKNAIELNGTSYYVTNHVYSKNVDKVRQALVKLGVLEDVPTEETVEEINNEDTEAVA